MVQPEPREPRESRGWWASLVEKVDRLTEAQRETAVVVAATQQKLDGLAKTVESLDRAVRSGNGHSLLVRHRALEEVVQMVREDFASCRDDVHALSDRITMLEKGHSHVASMWQFVYHVALIIGWVVTTGVAIYAALR